MSSDQRRDAVISASRRFVLALPLLLTVPAISLIGTAAIGDFAPSLVHLDPDAKPGWLAFDSLRWFHLLFATLWVAGTIILWRTIVVRTVGRRWLTALVALIPFCQVAYAKPLWSIESCDFVWVGEQTQRLGQFQLGAGLYVWLLVWVWWGTERWLMTNQGAGKNRVIAGPLARRAAASLGVIPLAIGVFMLSYQWLQDFPKITEPTLAMVVAAVFAIGAWLLIWRRVVVWTPAAIQATSVLAVACVGAPLGLLWLMAKWAVSDFSTVFWHSLPVIGWGVFMAATVALWPLREFFAHGDGPCCLKCGYSLRGLKATRCPECGDEPTLDQLWGGSESG